MDSQQIHDAMKHRVPVMCEGRKYERILEYISFYNNDGKRRLSVVLLDGNSSYRVLANKVELWEGQ